MRRVPPEEGLVTELIGPDEARRLLANLAVHRWPFEPVKAERFAELMRSGGWEFRHRVVRVEDGKLTNGRHRMAAILQSGCTLPFVVLRVGGQDATASNGEVH